MKTKIVAEISCNHKGSLTKAKQLIKEAKEAGVDSVKMQIYTPEDLTAKSDNEFFLIKKGLWKLQSLYDLYSKTQTPYEWFPILKDYADSIGVGLFSTAYSRRAVDYLMKHNNPIFKIASFEAIDFDFVDYVAQTGREVYVSTGIMELQEILELSFIFYKNKNYPTYFYCHSEYPTKPENMNLEGINTLKDRLSHNVGFSDHSKGYLNCAFSVFYGVDVIEKHFIGSLEDSEDKEFSLNTDEMEKLVKTVRYFETIKGTGFISRLSDEALESREIFGRHLFYNKDMEAYSVVKEEDIVSLRGRGYITKKDVIGDTTIRPVKKYEPLF